MGIGSFVLEEIGRNKRKGRLFLFLFPLLKREDEREKVKKIDNQKHFLQKNSFILIVNPESGYHHYNLGGIIL